MLLSIRVSLHLMISHLKRRSKMALEIPPTALVAFSIVWPLVTHSVPTLIFGLQKDFIITSGLTPSSAPALFGHSMSPSSAWSSLPFWINEGTHSPIVMTAAVIA